MKPHAAAHGCWRKERKEAWVHFNIRCNNKARGIWSLSCSDLVSLNMKRHSSSLWIDVRRLKTKLTSPVYQSQRQWSRHFQMNKRASLFLITLDAKSLFSKYIEYLYWVAKSRVSVPGLRGMAATTDALLLFQIRFTQHGLWLYTVWTAQADLSTALFAV